MEQNYVTVTLMSNSHRRRDAAVEFRLVGSVN